MAAYEQGERIWVIEQRGRAIWKHEGKRGTRGRHDVEELATPERARERLDAIVAEQVAKGFRLIDAERSVDAPLYGQTRPAAPTIGTRAGLDVAELCAAMREELASFTTVRALVRRFASVASTPCAWNHAPPVP